MSSPSRTQRCGRGGHAGDGAGGDHGDEPGGQQGAEGEGRRALADEGLGLEVLGPVDAQQHDHEQEQHHDGAGVDDDLDGGQEVGVLGDEQHGDAEQGGHQREGGVHGLLRR